MKLFEIYFILFSLKKHKLNYLDTYLEFLYQ